MTTYEALQILSRYEPCGHFTYQKVGNGEIWAKCEDCGDIFLQENLEAYRDWAISFEKALDTVRQFITKESHG